ncbi:thermostable hemolysin [Ahniella affigens]|uniref:Thermostable hemolysin n=1 Tax=Ahniella affigens TaxID=2021234 RepID=A0A2P1PYZ9_9GAMM|nr:thermostable hemolysin [Ahniella affigens]
MPITTKSARPSEHRSVALIDRSHARRGEVESFIADVYFARYGATLSTFMPHLLAFNQGQDELRAAVGLRSGFEGPLFVEQYLEMPAEAAISAQIGRPVARGDLVEAGNFGARYAGDARELILNMTHYLHLAGFRWVLFAATRQLRNTFDRLHLATVELAPAVASKLRDQHADWGSYYETEPTLMFGDIAAGHAFLTRQGALPAESNDGSWLQMAGVSA